MATTAPVGGATADREPLRNLEKQGIKTAGIVHWNYVPPLLVEAAIRRGEGRLADMGPFAAVTSPHTGRSPKGQVRRARPPDGKRCRLGHRQPALRPGQLRHALAADVRTVSERTPRIVRPGPVHRGRPRAPPERALHHPERLAGAVRPEHVHPARAAATSRRSSPRSPCCTRRSSRPTRHGTAPDRARSSYSTSTSARSSSAARATPVSSRSRCSRSCTTSCRKRRALHALLGQRRRSR